MSDSDSRRGAADRPEAPSAKELRVDKGNLYREEVITDLKVATLRRLVPIRLDGQVDPGRAVLYSGETQVLTGGGMLPVSCRVEASTLEEAVDAFPAAINEAIEELIEEAREMQRREASQLVIPTGPIPPHLGGGGRRGSRLELP